MCLCLLCVTVTHVWQVPPTMRFVLEGEMPSYLMAKDLILQIIGEITVSGGTYKAMEFTGPVIEAMTMEERMTICNMVVEAGGKNGTVISMPFPVDVYEILVHTPVARSLETFGWFG